MKIILDAMCKWIAIILLLSGSSNASAIIIWETAPLGYIWGPSSGVIMISADGTIFGGGGATDSPDFAKDCAAKPGFFLKNTTTSANGFAMGGVCRSETVLADGTVQWTEYRTTQYFLNGICPREDNGGARFFSGTIGVLACTHYRFEDQPEKKKNLGPPSCDMTGGTNPINISSGNKFQLEVDYNGAGLFPLQLERAYNSNQIPSTSLLGRATGMHRAMSNWLHSYDRRVSVGRDNLNAEVSRPDGTSIRFAWANGAWKSDTDIQDKLTTVSGSVGASASGWIYLAASSNITEEFDASGRLLRISDNRGNYQYLSYADGSGGLLLSKLPGKNDYEAPICNPPSGAPNPPSGALQCVTNSAGRALNFVYDSQQRVSQIVDPSGGMYTYAYGEESAVGAGTGEANLTSVTYPDGGKRTYWYNEPGATNGTQLPLALTGITDENGNRYATWRYDATGRAVSSEHGGGANRYNVSYYSNAHPSVTDSNGVSKTSDLKVVLGVSKNIGQSQPSGAGCSAASLSKTYDVNGNVATQVDFRGVLTTFSYDTSRNLETRRIEADGSAIPRTISTQWHPSLRLPTAIAEPKRIFTYEYDEVGNLLKKTQQNTLDEAGTKGLQAPVVGAAKVWVYSYNAQGQILTARGPRTDVAVIHEYTYDGQGNRVTVKNPLGQILTLSNYTADGMVGRLTDANGISTDYTYDTRNRLVSAATGGRITNYAYDLVGNLTSVATTGEAALGLRYDDAHRLVQVIAGDGASVNYTLDAYGNKTGETIVDDKGMLTRQIARVFDALNRLQQITGDIQ